MQQAALFRRERQLVIGVVLWFYLRNQRDLRENRPFTHKERASKERAYLTDRLSPLACYSLADNAEVADECSKLHYFADKHQNSMNGSISTMW
ncbi:hypothetical protein [Prevotella herbatica]|uniref:hypothetical protein n=1 Tax=Prevotella herbatica TaxID=2801997 RepID=UPI001A9264E2|nr:hypothetical protein [Prevotella herbatica]